MNHSISKIRRVHLREVWKHEAYDFTQWLQDNIDVLNGTLNLNLVSAEREQAAGAFSIDLVAEDDSGETYIIENQLEKSNHDHLGKLITYYASRQGRGAIWIVSEPRPEHVTALSWLNEASSADFYLVKLEAVRIDDSPAAPLLTLIVGPSEEAKSTGRAKRALVERDHIRKTFWALLLNHPDAGMHAHITPRYDPWLGVASGVPGLQWNYIANNDESGVELYIDRGKEREQENERIFNLIHAHRERIDAAIHGPVSWMQLDGRRACRIRVVLPGGTRSPEEEWAAIQGRMVRTMNELVHAIQPVLAEMSSETES